MSLTKNTLLKNRYRIVAPIAEGGFGAVYRAEDTTLQRVCAVKENLQLSAAAQAQFQREASLLAGVNHRALPRVTDHFEEEGRQYLVMDFVAGESLSEKLGKVGLEQALDWTRQAAAALDYLHRQTPPIYHRDIKPANIIVQADGRAMLVDFGIAKVIDSTDVTHAGAQAVTAGYSPPEQYSGTTDARSDVYALGATLFALLTGEKPTDALARLQGAKIDISALPAVVKPILGKALALAPHERYATMAAFVAELEAVNVVPEQTIAPVTVNKEREGAASISSGGRNLGRRYPRLAPYVFGAGVLLVVVALVVRVLVNGSADSVNPATNFGEPLWTITDGISEPLSLTTAGELLYVGETENRYHILSLEGEILETHTLARAVDDLAVLGDGRLVSVDGVSAETRIHVLQGDNEISTFGEAVSFGGLFTPFNPRTVVAAGDDIFVLEDNGGAAFESARIYQFDPAGTLRNTIPLDFAPHARTQIARDAMGALYLLAQDRLTVWRISADSPATPLTLASMEPIGVAVGEQGDLYALTDFGAQLTQFSADGEQLATATIDLSGTPTDIIYHANRVIVATQDGVVAFRVK